MKVNESGGAVVTDSRYDVRVESSAKRGIIKLCDSSDVR